MKMTNHLRAAALSSLVVAFAASLAACETEDASKAVVENGYPRLAPGGDPANQIVVYRAWWVATYFPDPVAGGATSAEQRSVPASDYAYAVLAPGWEEATGTPPSELVVVKSKAPLSLARGETLHILVDDQTFAGRCVANQPLSQDEADLITQRIFPGEFAGMTYDAATCKLSPPVGTASDGDAGGD